MRWWERVRRRQSAPRPPVAAPEEDGEGVALRRDLATARLELQAAQAALAKERTRREAVEAGQSARLREDVQDRLAAVFGALAAPLSQLRTQCYLVETGVDVSVSDALTLVGQMEQALADLGLEPVGVPAARVRYDAETMAPLREGALEAGSPVRIRFIGYRFGGEVIRKAFVEANGGTTGG